MADRRRTSCPAPGASEAARVGGARPRTPWALGVAVLVLWALLGLGCTPSPSERFLLAMYEGKRAYNAGRYDEAAEAYRHAARRATRVKDRDEARFLQGRMHQRLGQPQRAQEVYRLLARESPKGPRTARAIFEIALIEIRSGDAERGWEQLQAAVVDHPNHGSARLALAQVVRHLADQDGEEAARSFLDGHLARFDGTEADQQSEYELARSFERSGLLEKARDGYVASARAHPYPWGNLTDDAYWRAANIEEKLGRHEQAIELLRELLQPVEEDISGGRYERPRFPAAQQRIAELYRDHLGDDATARREFHRLYERHPESVRADDALWHEALLVRRLGDSDEVCDVTSLLRDDYPDSRYVRCLSALCPSEPRPTDGRPCPPYIERMVLEAEPGAGAP